MPTPELVYTVTTFHNFGHTRERAVELVEVNVGKLNKLFLGGILTNSMVKKGQSNFLAPFGELVVNILNLSESESCRVFKAVLLLPLSLDRLDKIENLRVSPTLGEVQAYSDALNMRCFIDFAPKDNRNYPVFNKLSEPQRRRALAAGAAGY